MSISSVKGDLVSDRFQLLRIEPCDYVNDALTLISGSDYGMTFFADTLSKIERNGVELTRVTTLSDNDQYTYNEETGALVVRLADAPSDSNIICVFFYMFFTGEKYRRLPETPTTSSDPLRNWEPRIAKYIPVNQSVSNALSGVMTYANTSFTILNGDKFFEYYLPLTVSFCNKEVEVWQCINSIDHIEQVYRGLCKNISMQGGTVTINLHDPFTKLAENSFMGDDIEEVRVLKSASYWTGTREQDAEKAIPFIFGENSPYSLNELTPYFVGPPSGHELLHSEKYEAVLTNYVQGGGAGTNDSFTLCRVDSAGLRTLNFGTTVREYHVSMSSTDAAYYLTGHNLKVGDHFRLNAAGTEWAYVSYVGDTFQVEGNDYNVYLTGYGGFDWPHPDLAASAYAHDAPYINHFDNTTGIYSWLIPTKDYTWSETTTSSGNKTIKVTLTSAVTFNPDDGDKLFYMVRPVREHTHAEAIEAMVESVGLTADSTSFTAADSALDANVLFSIPTIDQGNSYSNLRYYVEGVLKSTMGFLTINTSGNVEYKLIGAPSSTDVIDRYLYDRVNVTVDYGDIHHEVEAVNPHGIKTALVSGLSENKSFEKATSLKAKHLHSIDKTYKLSHFLASIANRIDDILSLVSSRRATYSFKTATHNIDTDIGDDVLLTSDRILGGASSKALKVTSILKSSSSVSVEADDMGDLT
jgi:hypothetical protein